MHSSKTYTFLLNATWVYLFGVREGGGFWLVVVTLRLYAMASRIFLRVLRAQFTVRRQIV